MFYNSSRKSKFISIIKNKTKMYSLQHAILIAISSYHSLSRPAVYFPNLLHGILHRAGDELLAHTGEVTQEHAAHNP